MAKEEMIKISCNIPLALRDRIQEYNRTAQLKINISRVVTNALTECINKVENK